MRVCVAHFLSFLFVLLALLMNLYFLIKGHREHSSLSDSLLRHEKSSSIEFLTDLVEDSISNYDRQLNILEHQLREIENAVNDLKNLNYNAENSFDHLTASSTMVNYADEKLGAVINGVRAEPVRTTSSLVEWQKLTNPPVNVLRANMEPGCCYAFKNGEAEIEINLAKEAFIECVRIEHIPKSMSPTKDTSSAPRNFSVYGVDVNTGQSIHLGNFEFNNQIPSQVFELTVKRIIRIIRFKFTGNHGNPKYTCIYRILVYGTPK